MDTTVDVNRCFRYDEKLFEEMKNMYGDCLSSLFRALRTPGKRLYIRLNTLIKPAQEIYDTLRSRGLKVFKNKYLEEAIYFEVEGPFKIPVEDNIVIVNKKAAESVYLGAHVYAPGVLKVSKNLKKNSYVTVVSPLFEPVGWGKLVVDPSDIWRRKKGIVVQVEISKYRTPKLRELPEYRLGLFYEQSLPAIITGRNVEPKRNETIVDMCAAPGGKTTHVHQLVKGKAKIYAFDHSKSRISRMLREIERLKMENIRIYKIDSRYLHVDFPFLVGKVNKIILDPPCSSLGVRPKLYDEKTYEEVLNLSNYQIQFFKPAYELLKKNGLLIYSTCTVTFKENEYIIEKVLEKYRFDIEEVLFKKLGSPGIYGKNKNKYLRFHPHIHDVTGYFIARLRKI